MMTFTIINCLNLGLKHLTIIWISKANITLALEKMLNYFGKSCVWLPCFH